MLDRPSAGLIAAARYAMRAARTCRRDPAQFRRRLQQEFQERQNALVNECRLRLRLTLPRAFRGAAEPDSAADSTGVLLRARVLDDLAGDLSDVVLIIDRNPVTIANSVAARAPSATVHLLTQRPLSRLQRARLRPGVTYQPCATIADRVDYLSEHRQPQLIVERGRNLSRAKVACFRELFPFVAVGGAYVVEALDAVPPEPAKRAQGLAISELLRWIDALCRGAQPRQTAASTRDLADSAAGLAFYGNAVVVRKAVAHQFKLRDSTANATLDARFGHRWGSVLASRPAFRWHSNARLFIHGEGPISETPTIDVPERFLRRYESAQCWPMQRVRFSDYWLPDTFRHPMNSVLTHRRLVNSSRHMTRLQPEATTPPEPTRSAHGPLFYFDSEYPGHFGHVMTEVVSRYWGWCAARERVPDVRPLISLGQGQQSIPKFQRAIFASLGIDADSIEYVRSDECVEVDELYAATPDFVLPHYLNVDLAAVWDRIRRGCARAEMSASPEMLFVSRRSHGLRTCTNGAEVEALFARLGFHIIYPEDHDFADQVTMFHRAKIIAGFGGSGMFTSMFAPEATLILISGDGYDASNEYMIKSVIGGDIHYFWGDSHIKHPPGRWTWAAYQSNFVFDVDRFAPEVARVIESERVG